MMPTGEDVARVLIAHPWPNVDGPFRGVCPSCKTQVMAGPNSPEHADHQAEHLLALFEAAVPRIKAEALREAADEADSECFCCPASIGSPDPAPFWLRTLADRIESEAGKQ